MIPGFPGVELWIWPRHMLRVHGRMVLLSRREGDLLSVLTSAHGRFFTAAELLVHSYVDADDEPDYGCETIVVRIYNLRRKLARYGISIDLKGRKSGERTYRLDGFSLMPDWCQENVTHRLSPVAITEIVSRWKDGEKETSLASEYGIHLRTVYKLVKPLRPKSGKHRRLKQNVVSEIRARWKDGLCPKALAYEYGVHLDTVHRVIRPERRSVAN